MKAIRYTAAGVGGLTEVPDPVAGPGQLVLAVGSSGICGTDLHIIAADFPNSSLPRIIGHEFAGTVVEVGEGVTGFAVGELVAADPNFYCGECEWCAQGAYNLCVKWGALGLTVEGAMAEKVVVDAKFAVVLPEGLDAEVGALIEPLSCVLHGFDRGGVQPGRTMLIYGGGMMGLTATIAASHLGLDVYVVEPHQWRQQRALQVGAVASAGSVAELNGPQEFHFVLDASGVPAAIADGFRHLRTRGTYLQMGVAPTSAVIDYTPYLVFEREWSIIGSMSVADKYVEAAQLMPAIADRMRVLVTHRFGLDRFSDAIAAMRQPDAIKVHIQP